MKRRLGVGLTVITLAGLAWIVTPMVLIRPDSAQTAAGVALAYTLRVRAAMVPPLLLILGVALAVALWARLATWRGRLLTGVATAVLALCAFMGRSNYFEWMFNPLSQPEFDDVAAADHLTEDDLVLAVALGDEARGYPVRALAYHHVVNDVLAGHPIVATY